VATSIPKLNLRESSVVAARSSHRTSWPRLLVAGTSLTLVATVRQRGAGDRLAQLATRFDRLPAARNSGRCLWRPSLAWLPHRRIRLDSSHAARSQSGRSS